MDGVEQARILIVDDEPPNVRLLEVALSRAGYTRINATTDSRDVGTLFSSFEPDILLLDLHMPYVDGFDVMEQLQRKIPKSDYLPILVLTADITPRAKTRALSVGAKDFVTKPFEMTELLLRVGNLLETRRLHVRLSRHNEVLEDQVRVRTADLAAAQMEILDRLALAAEYRDDDTGQHTQRVGRMAALLARTMDLEGDQVDVIRRAAPLHDVGKIGISDTILLKPGRLSAQEFERIKEHTSIGAGILSGSAFSILQMAEVIALTHHERWDGSGYLGMSGDDIPLAGRIVAVVDVYDALIHERPYKRAWSIPDAIAEIRQQTGRQFDPMVIEAFTAVQQRVDLGELTEEWLNRVLVH
jgi:putative two-component system response regulator